MDEGFADAILSLVTTYQTAFQTFWDQNKNKKDFTVKDAENMTKDFWEGTMMGTGMMAAGKEMGKNGSNPFGF